MSHCTFNKYAVLTVTHFLFVFTYNSVSGNILLFKVRNIQIFLEICAAFKFNQNKILIQDNPSLYPVA